MKMNRLIVVLAAVILPLAVVFVMCSRRQEHTRQRRPLNPGTVSLSIRDSKRTIIIGGVEFLVDIAPLPKWAYDPGLTMVCISGETTILYREEALRTGMNKSIPVETRRRLCVPFDTCQLSNGIHTAFGIACFNPALYQESPRVQFRTRNIITEFSSELSPDVKQPDMKCRVKAKLNIPAEWRIDVLRGSGRSYDALKYTVIQSRTGRGSKVEWVWDGKDSRGMLVKDRMVRPKWTSSDRGWVTPYFMRVSAYRGSKLLQQTSPIQEEDRSDGNQTYQ